MKRVLAYALATWDWESQTLFGPEQSEFQDVLDGWPGSLNAETALYFVHQPLNYFINGGGMGDPEASERFGLSRVECEALMEKIDSASVHERQ